MLALEERFMIREMYRKGVSISEIARRTRRDRKTIRQVVNAPELVPAKPSRQVKACKIDPSAPYLEQRVAEGVLNARKLYGEILAQGYLSRPTYFWLILVFGEALKTIDLSAMLLQKDVA